MRTTTPTPYANQTPGVFKASKASKASIASTAFTAWPKRSLRSIASSVAIFTAAAFSITPSTAQAQTTQWDSGSGDWADSGNWTAGVPTTSLDAIFANGSTSVINVTQNQTYRNMFFSGDGGAFTFRSTNAAAPTIGNGAGNFRLGSSTSGASLTLDGVHLIARGASQVGIQIEAGAANTSSNNTLTITGANSTFEVISSAQLAIGRVLAGTQSADNNLVSVLGGGTLKAGTLALGTDGVNNRLIVSGAGSNFAITALATLGTGTKANRSNLLQVANGATGTIGGALSIQRGAAHVAQGSALTVAGGIEIGLGGRLYGAGSVTANVSQRTNGSGTGALAEVGDDAGAFGVLSVTGNWDNRNMTLKLDVGDLSETAVAGTDYDQLAINGVFTLGGVIEIDLSQAVFTLESESIQAIAWQSFTGQAADVTLSFINGSPMGYSFNNDGLYLHAIPEATTVWMILSTTPLLLMLTRRRRVQ